MRKLHIIVESCCQNFKPGVYTPWPAERSRFRKGIANLPWVADHVTMFTDHVQLSGPLAGRTVLLKHCQVSFPYFKQDL